LKDFEKIKRCTKVKRIKHGGKIMATQPKVRFAAIGLNHAHIYGQVNLLLRAGAELVSYYAIEPDLAARFGSEYPQASLARTAEEILEDQTIHLVVSAAIPNERAPLGITAMQHGKDYMSDKPAFTTLDQLAEARRVQAETGRIYSVCFSERFENAATVKAGELVQAGAIGRVVQTIGLGPHRVRPSSRPEWFFQREKYGGILTDIASHQVDQFLFFTGSTQAEVVSAQVANYNYPQYPGLEDFGDMTLRGNGGTGYIRVDWFTPEGLATWGDTRLTILGTEGYIELRKNCDIAGRPGSNHLFIVDQQATRYIDCSGGDLPYGRQLLADVTHRTETTMPQAHAFLASELALQAQAQAKRLGNLKDDG
jgi:predicted dehydrogenase